VLKKRRLLCCLIFVAAGLFVPWGTKPSHAYVEAPHSLGTVVQLSTNIVLVQVEKVDKKVNVIIYRKVRDLKGKHPTDIIKHNIGRGGFNPREWQFPMEWAEVGKPAVFFHNGSASETCIGTYWYQAYANGEWWGMSHGEPFLLRSFAGRVDKLAAAVTDIVAGKEVIVPCMVDGNKDDLHLRRAKIQRMKAGLKLADYNPKRDFVGWGGEDFRRLAGMPGFTHYSALSRVDPEAQAISSVDINGDGKPDLCLVGAGKVVLLQNGGESMSEISLPLTGGCRAAVWADYNGDGKPDLFLATPTGPKLLTNLGGTFRDDTHLLPKEPHYNLTAAAWIDYDGDGKPDLLIGNGFHGLRLYRNKGYRPAPSGPVTPKFGKWHFIGPFDNRGGNGFAVVYPPEQEINLSKEYAGKNGTKAVWREGKFTDGAVNNLALFEPKNNTEAAVYLYREIECPAAVEIPISLGSDDTLTVWLNGKKLLVQNVSRACAPDQERLTLSLRAGKNHFLMKVCQGTAQWEFYFAAAKAAPVVPAGLGFEDVSAKVGLGPDGIGSDVKGDTLTVCDVNGDGRPDFLYGAGTGLMVLNTPKGFVAAKDSGISYKPGKVGPVFGDYNNDGFPDLFVPQNGGCKLFRNDGTGHFKDVTKEAGLDKNIGRATCAAWGDVDNDGRLDLVVGCLGGVNRFFRNRGDGTFDDATAALGLNQRVFNSQAVCLVDLNNDGVLDMVFNNEGQESCILLGNPTLARRKTPVTVRVAGADGVAGSRVRVLNGGRKAVAVQYICGGEGRGGQRPPHAHFALEPGKYIVEVRFSSGIKRQKEIRVAATPLRGVIDENTPKLE
jgi:hypothetical protein